MCCCCYLLGEFSEQERIEVTQAQACAILNPDAGESTFRGIGSIEGFHADLLVTDLALFVPASFFTCYILSCVASADSCASTASRAKGTLLLRASDLSFENGEGCRH